MASAAEVCFVLVRALFSGTEQEFIALLRDTHLGSKVFRVYFCSEPPTTDPAAVAAFYGDKADGLVCRMQCYPRSVEAAMGKTIPMNVDLRMSGFSVVGSVVKLPADQLGGGVGDINVPWRLRKKLKRSEKKHKKHKLSKWEAAAGPKAAAAADAAAAAAGTTAAAIAGEDTEEPLGNTVEADLSKLEAEGLYFHAPRWAISRFDAQQHFRFALACGMAPHRSITLLYLCVLSVLLGLKCTLVGRRRRRGLPVRLKLRGGILPPQPERRHS